MYFRLSWKTWKALFIEFVFLFYCIYFLLLFVICLSVENNFTTHGSIFRFMFMLYIFGYICELIKM